MRVNVPKDWIYENKVSGIKAVKCQPYYQELKLNYIDENDDNGIYDLYTPGFSTLAILENFEGNEAQIPSHMGIDKSKYKYFWINLITVFIITMFALGGILLRKHHLVIIKKIKKFEFAMKMKYG